MDVKDELVTECVCRTCMSSECLEYRSLNSVVEITSHDEAQTEVATILDCLSFCLQLKKPQSPHLPQYICVDCFSSLCSCYEFIKMAKQSEEKLLATTQLEDACDDADIEEAPVEEVGYSEVKSEGVEVLWLNPFEQDHETRYTQEVEEEYAGSLEENNDKGVAKFECQLCGYESSSRCNMTHHYIGKHKMQPNLNCKLCPFKSSDIYNLKRHCIRKHRIGPRMEFHHTEESQNEESKVVVSYPEELIEESKIRHICEICAYETSYRSCLKRHYRKKHKVQPTAEQLENKNLAMYEALRSIKKRMCLLPYRCEMCSYETICVPHLKRHYTKKHHVQPSARQLTRKESIVGLNPYKCEKCNFECRVPINLKRHYKQIHKFVPNADKLRPIKCMAFDETQDPKVDNEPKVSEESKVDEEFTVDGDTESDDENNTLESVEYELERASNCDTKSLALSSPENDINTDPEYQPENKNKTTFGCEVCPYKTRFKQGLKRHYMTKHKAELAAGDLDGRDFGAYEALKCINKKENRWLPYQCQLCTYETTILFNLRKHYRGKHKLEPSEKRLKQKESAAGLTTHKCGLCNSEFRFSNNLQLHYKRTHKISLNSDKLQPNNNVANTESREAKTELQYNLGGTSNNDNISSEPDITHDESQAEQHTFSGSYETITEQLREQDMPSDQLHCQLCEYRAESNLSLEHHYVETHKVLLTPEQVQQWKSTFLEAIDEACTRIHRCELCQKQFENSYVLECHLLTHKDLKAIKCRMCNFECRYQNTMRSHYKSQHKSDSEFFSQCCNAQEDFKETEEFELVKESAIDDEPKIDEEIVPFECVEFELNEACNDNMCSAPNSPQNEIKADFDYGSSDNDSAQAENKKEVMFECEVCTYKTRFKQGLKRHYMTKHKAQLAAGQLEGRDFGAYEALKSVNKRKNPWLPYQCQLCTYETNILFNLRKHYRGKHKVEPTEEQLRKKESATGLNTFKCGLCSCEFRFSENLHLHYKRSHKISAISNTKPTNNNLGLSEAKKSKVELKGSANDDSLCSASEIVDVENKSEQQLNNEPSDQLHCQLCEYKAESNTKLEHHYLEIHKVLLTPEQVKQYKPNLLEAIDESGTHRCELCQKQFENSFFLECHMIAHKDLKPTKCKLCNFECRYHSNMRSHCKSQHGFDPDSEVHKPSSSSTLAAELEADDEIKSVDLIQYEPEESSSSKICETANFTFNEISTKEKFDRIIAFVTECESKETTEKPQNETKSLKTTFQCEECLLEFRTSYLLESHLVEHKGLKKLQCRLCDYECSQPNNMSRHYRFKHDTTVPTDAIIHHEQYRGTSDGGNKGSSPQTVSSLLQTTEQGPFNFMCSKCSKGLGTLKSLKEHERKCSKGSNVEKLFKCSQCSSSFFEARFLRSHQAKVHSERVHQCEICKKAFKTRDQLISHKARHEKTRPYQCDQCTRSYVGKGELRVHQRIHTGELPYGCDICSKRFRTADRLTVHREKTHLDLTFKCTQCPEEFDTRHKLKMHLYKHNGIPYKCEVCSKDFSARHQFRRHMEFVHAKSVSDEDLAAMYYKNMKRCNPFDVFNLGIAATKIANSTNIEN